MKTLIISYSFTGNNGKLSNIIAERINADFVEIKEKRKRTILTILLDVIFNRTPKIQKSEKIFEEYEHLLFIAPIWFGKIASPLRTLFEDLKNTNKKFSFISLSSGADGVNPDLEKELIQRTGIKPKTVINPLIREILPTNPKPSRKEINTYKISEDEADDVVKKIITELNKCVTL